MRIPNFLKQPLLFAPGVISLFILLLNDGCNNSPEPPPGHIPLSGYLDTLWTDSATFAKLEDTARIIFVFRIGSADSLTLDGWVSPKQITLGFKKNPEISLLKGRTDSLVPLAPGTYLGNQVLHHKQIDMIKALLDSNHAHYVLFAPYSDKGHIGYAIYLGYDNPRAQPLVPFTTPPVNTGQSSNPSPPKNYSDTENQ